MRKIKQAVEYKENNLLWNQNPDLGVEAMIALSRSKEFVQLKFNLSYSE